MWRTLTQFWRCHPCCFPSYIPSQSLSDNVGWSKTWKKCRFNMNFDISSSYSVLYSYMLEEKNWERGSWLKEKRLECVSRCQLIENGGGGRNCKVRRDGKAYWKGCIFFLSFAYFIWFSLSSLGTWNIEVILCMVASHMRIYTVLYPL